jgi:phage protein D
MIAPPTQGVSPKFEITVNGVEFNYMSLHSINISLEENVHDVAKIRVAGIPTRAITEYLNAAVEIKVWLNANFFQHFVGTIIEVDPTSLTSEGLVNSSPFQDATITCLGASYDMRGPRERMWQNSTIADVVTELSRRYRFSADVPRTKSVYPQLMQSNESDWQFLVRYANMLGLRVNCHGTHIHVYDPYKAVGRNTSLHRLSTLRGDQFDLTQYPGQIFEFNGSFLDRRKGGTINKPVISVAQPDGQRYDVSWREINREADRAEDRDLRTHWFAESYDEAAVVLGAAQKRTYDYQASATVMCIPGVVPGGVVDLTEYDSNFDGLWYVHSVDHTLITGTFSTALKLKRNRASQLEYSPVDEFRDPPAPEWNKDRWQARKATVHVYS